MDTYESKMNSIIEEATNILAESSGRLKSERGSSAGDDVAFGMRDTMLAKCKEAIETLYVDIAEEKRRRKEAESIVADLQSTNRRLEEKLKQQSTQVMHLTSNLAAAENSNQMLEQESEHLREELKRIDSRSPTLRHEVMEYESAQLREKQQELESLAASVTAVKKQLSQLETENEELRLDLEEMRGKHDDLLHKCERLQTQAKISDTLKADLKRAQEDYYRYLDEEKERSGKAQAVLQRKYEELEARLREKFAQKDLALKQELAQTIDNIQRDLDVSTAEHLKTREECHNLKEENRRLKEYLSAKQEEFEKWKATKIEQLERLQKAIESKSAIAQAQDEAAKKDRVEFKAQLDRLQSDNSLLIDDLARAQEKWKKLEAKLTEERNQYEQLNKSTNEQQGLLDQLHQVLSEREEESAALRKKETQLLEQMESLQTKYAVEKQSLLKAHEEHLELLSTQHRRELEEELTRLRLDVEREKVQKRECEGRLKSVEEDLQKATSQRDQLAAALSDLDDRVQQLKCQHEEQAAKTKSSSLRASDQLVDMSREVRSEREKRSQLEKVNRDLQQKLFDMDAKLKQESALFRRESERMEAEMALFKRRYDGRSPAFVENRVQLEKLKDEIAEEVNYLKQWYESLRQGDIDKREKWVGRFMDGLNSVRCMQVIFRLETKSVKGSIETPVGSVDI